MAKFLIVTKFAFALGAFLSANAFGDRLDDLEKEIAEIRKIQEELNLHAVSTEGSMRTFLRDDLTFGGFYESAFLTLAGPDTDLQSAATSNLLGINLAATFTPRIRFTSQFYTGMSFPLVNHHNDPRGSTVGLPVERQFGSLTFGAIVAQGYLEFRNSDQLILQAGTGFAPYGVAPQRREPVLFIRRGGPQIIRESELVNTLWSGVHLFGNFFFNTGIWGYSLYSFTPLTFAKNPGLGGRVHWSSPQDSVRAGISSQYGRNAMGTYQNVGADFQAKVNDDLMITTEFSRKLLNGEDPWSVYIEPSFPFLSQSVLFFAFGDYANSSLNQTVTLADPVEKWEYGVGINWLPVSLVRVRAAVAANQYIGRNARASGRMRDYVSLDLSFGVSF